MVHHKRADSSSQLDVEKMIVDYLAFEANKAILEESASYTSRRVANPSGDRLETAMENVESWASIFRQHFPGEKFGSKASFRIKLLQLSVLCSQRIMPGLVDDEVSLSLEALKTSHGRRRSHFSPSKVSSPLRSNHVNQLPIGVEYRAHHIETLRENGCTNIDPSLLHLIPLFCKLSAYRGALEVNSASMIRDWMNLAGQLMLQTSIELLLVHGVSEADKIREAFSWTWKPESSAEEREVSEWESIRNSWAAMLVPQSKSTPLAHHLIQVAAAYPQHAFERDLMNFLESLHDGVSHPRLTQIEDGRIDGLSPAQSALLLRRAHVSL